MALAGHLKRNQLRKNEESSVSRLSFVTHTSLTSKLSENHLFLLR